MEHDRKYRLKRAFAGFFILILFSQVARTMAADLIAPAPTDIAQPTETPSISPSDSPSPSPTESPSTSPTPSAIPTPTASDTSTPVIITPSNSPSPSPTPTKAPPHAIANQALVIHVPQIVNVDPRANSVALPAISATGSDFLLVCAFGNGLTLDAYSSDQLDPKFGTLFSGDRSSFIRTSGSTASALSALNSAGGLRGISSHGSIVGKSITLEFVAVSEPTINPALCNVGNLSNTRTIEIAALGLDMDMKQADVRLNK